MAVVRGLAFLFLVFFVENAAAQLPCNPPPKHHPPIVRIQTPPPPPACPFGWRPFDTKCYRFFPQAVNWATAEKLCQAHGANLASVRSKARNDFFLSLLPWNSRAWIGGHDGEVEGQWLWSDGSSFNFANWCFREPNNLRGENCLEINWTGNRCWNDISCYTTMGYICARKH